MYSLPSILFPPSNWTDRELAEPLNKNKNYRLKKIFRYNKHKTAVRSTIYQNSTASKVLLAKFWLSSWQLPVYNFVTISNLKWNCCWNTQISIQNAKVWGNLKNLFWRTIFWCNIAENIFGSKILQENLWLVSVSLRIFKNKSLIGDSLL